MGSARKRLRIYPPHLSWWPPPLFPPFSAHHPILLAKSSHTMFTIEEEEGKSAGQIFFPPLYRQVNRQGRPRTIKYLFPFFLSFAYTVYSAALHTHTCMHASRQHMHTTQKHSSSLPHSLGYLFPLFPLSPLTTELTINTSTVSAFLHLFVSVVHTSIDIKKTVLEWRLSVTWGFLYLGAYKAGIRAPICFFKVQKLLFILPTHVPGRRWKDMITKKSHVQCTLNESAHFLILIWIYCINCFAVRWFYANVR